MTVFGNVDYIPKSKIGITDKKGLTEVATHCNLDLNMNNVPTDFIQFTSCSLDSCTSVGKQSYLNLDLTNPHVNYAGPFAEDTINYDD